MPSRKISPNTPPADRHQALKERAEQVRDKAGRFIRPKPDATPETAAPSQDAPSLGTVQVRGDAHPNTYGLQVNEGGLGLHAAPGASVIVEPIMPTKAGLAVFYLKERPGPVIFDLTHDFRPDLARPFAPGSEVIPMIDVCEPITGVARCLRADRIEKLHRITGIYTPVEVAERHPPAPTPLPLMGICPETMGEHYADDTAAYPLVRPGETVIYDPNLREPTHGVLCVLQWNSGRRSLLQTNRRQSGGKGALRWWVDPINRPAGREALERRLADNVPGDMLHTSDGPFTADHLRSRIVGTVVAVLVPRHRLPLQTREHGVKEDPDAAPKTNEQADEEGEAPLTVESAAALPFEAYTFDTAMRSPTEWAAEFNLYALAMCVADKTLRMTKPELMAFIREAGGRGDKTDEAMFHALNSAQETFEGWGNLLATARSRYLVAASAATLEEQTEQQHPETEA